MGKSGIPGTARYLGGKASAELKIDDSYVMLPSFDEIKNDKDAIMRETIAVEYEMNPWSGRRQLQETNGRYVLVEPPQPPLTTEELDRVSELPYAWLPHPSF